MTPRTFVKALKAHDRFLRGLPRGQRANFTLANLSGLRLPGVNLASAQMSGVDFTGGALPRARFAAADLFAAEFSDADLRRADFGRADLRGAMFKGAWLEEADFTGADLRPGAYMDATWRLTGPQGNARRAMRRAGSEPASARCPSPRHAWTT